MSINTSYQLHLKIITPIHVGGQQEKNLLRGIDYLQVDRRFYLVNKAAVFNTESGIHPDELAGALARGDEHHLARLLQKDKNRFLVPLKGTPGSTGEIKAFIKDGAFGKAYIPGSSIKGALRSAVAHYFCGGFATKNPDETYIKKFEESLFRFIKVSDIPVGETRIYKSKVASVVEKNGRHNLYWKTVLDRKVKNIENFTQEGFVTSFESPRTGLVLNNCNLLIGNIFSDTFKNHKDFKLTAEAKDFLTCSDPINSLFKAINFASTNHLKRELRFFKKYEQGNKVKLIINGIEVLLKLIDHSDNPKTALLRFGSGSGFHSISGDWQFEDHISENWNNPYYPNGKLKFKSRRIAFNDNSSDFYLMGYILLSKEPFLDLEHKPSAEDECKTVVETAKVEPKPVEEYKPILMSADSIKNQTIVDARVVGQQGIQMLVSPFIQGYEQKIFPLRYPGGMDEGSIIRVKVNFIRKSLKDGFNLSFYGLVKM